MITEAGTLLTTPCYLFFMNIFDVFQVLESMSKDSGIPINSLQVDGGMTANTLLMQLQADLTGIPVGRLLW